MKKSANHENLLVLAYFHDSRQTMLAKLSELELRAKEMNDVNPKNLEIDVEKKTWSFHEHKDIPIGQGRKDLGKYNFSRFGIIGVYNQFIYEHVRQLMLDAQNAVKPPHGVYIPDDD